MGGSQWRGFGRQRTLRQRNVFRFLFSGGVNTERHRFWTWGVKRRGFVPCAAAISRVSPPPRRRYPDEFQTARFHAIYISRGARCGAVVTRRIEMSRLLEHLPAEGLGWHLGFGFVQFGGWIRGLWQTLPLELVRTPRLQQVLRVRFCGRRLGPRFVRGDGAKFQPLKPTRN